MVFKYFINLFSILFLLISCNSTKMGDGGQSSAKNGADASAALSSAANGAANNAPNFDKFTSAELQAVETHLEEALPLAITAIVKKIIDAKPALASKMTFADLSPYSALDSTKITKSGDTKRSLTIDAAVAKDGQKDTLLQTTIQISLVLLNGCLDQYSFLEKVRCLTNLTNAQSEADLGQSNLPGITFTWIPGVIQVDILNPVTGTGVLQALKYQADLTGTAAGMVQGELSSEATNGFAFKVNKLGISVNVGGLLAMLNPANGEKEMPISFNVDVELDQAQLQGNVVINSKTDVLMAKIDKPLVVHVQGRLGDQSQASILGGVVEASLARHISAVADLNPDTTRPLTIVIAHKFTGSFDPKTLGDMVSAYGVVAVEMSLPQGSGAFKQVRCDVPQSSPISYKPLITEVVYNFGRVLETSYGWTAQNFTGAAPGAIRPICTIQ